MSKVILNYTPKRKAFVVIKECHKLYLERGTCFERDEGASGYLLKNNLGEYANEMWWRYTRCQIRILEILGIVELLK